MAGWADPRPDGVPDSGSVMDRIGRIAQDAVINSTCPRTPPCTRRQAPTRARRRPPARSPPRPFAGGSCDPPRGSSCSTPGHWNDSSVRRGASPRGRSGRSATTCWPGAVFWSAWNRRTRRHSRSSRVCPCRTGSCCCRCRAPRSCKGTPGRTLLRDYWARRFEGEVARAWQMARDDNQDLARFGPAALADLIGGTALAEARDVLPATACRGALADEPALCRAFVARVVRLRYFAPGTRGCCFPAVRDWAAVDRWLEDERTRSAQCPAPAAGCPRHWSAADRRAAAACRRAPAAARRPALRPFRSGPSDRRAGVPSSGLRMRPDRCDGAPASGVMAGHPPTGSGPRIPWRSCPGRHRPRARPRGNTRPRDLPTDLQARCLHALRPGAPRSAAVRTCCPVCATP